MRYPSQSTERKIHCQERALPWDEKKARTFARKAYERMFQFKWTPPGRGLWMMGTQFMYDRGGAALNNCGFVSTASDTVLSFAGATNHTISSSISTPNIPIGCAYPDRSKQHPSNRRG
ncbi:MAG: hypothetical protein KGZ25_00185 [Planctomycetes bacterium]|nr:hypothetical protein [Planctomycetota bacterium]